MITEAREEVRAMPFHRYRPVDDDNTDDDDDDDDDD